MTNKLIRIVCLALVLILCLGGCGETSESGAAEDVGDIVGASADGEALGLGMDILLRARQMIHAKDHIHAGGADDKHVFHKDTSRGC